ncbi:putative ankyrin and HET domain-containing protein [Rosellinia necatrix]|uniref:Putative ankyrin and HET domain-containing protein n=1 Tax=Rosellinia necatrix TaxID=77044 RepID=A0A1W2TAK8_ROSNE|nr:putative ankyrin and HET domain-containing protein [Rosellinia necatrix]
MSARPLPFTYKALRSGEIRLVFSAIEEDRVVWTLRTIQLHSEGLPVPIAFDALSYTWGDQSHTFPFVCNGQELRIHQNLRDALPYLARRKSPLPIWIDAVCINQSDIAEKFAQIRMMHSIYGQATQVWVWLGCGAEHSREAIRLLPEVGRAGAEMEMHKRKLDGTSPPEFTTLPPAGSPIWQSIKELMLNKWLDRLWVVQEAALARRIRVLYEHEEINWGILKKVVYHGWNLEDIINQHPAVGGYGPRNNDTIFLVRDIIQNPDPKAPWSNRLLSVLRITIDLSQCADPRDRVFGVLGFATQDQLQQLGLSEDMCVEELYTRLTHFLLSHGSTSYQNWWDILQLATATDKRPGLPSWCPDYHSWNQRSPHIRNLEEPVYLRGWPNGYCASRATSTPLPSTNVRELKVRGRIFDSVKRLYPFFPDIRRLTENITSDETIRQAYLTFRAWERPIAAHVLGPDFCKFPDDPHSELGLHQKDRLKVTVDDYWRTLVGNITKYGDYTLTYETFRSMQIILEQCVSQESTAGSATELAKARSDPWEQLYIHLPSFKLLNAIQSTLGGRRLYCTEKGRLGFGPKRTEVNDQVCVLNNANAAHLLRRASKTKRRKTFRLVGDSYYYGVMEGQIENFGTEEADIVLV